MSLAVLSLFLALLSKVALAALIETYPTIKVDVAVIGGGSAGTYSAVRLKDMGKSVVVIGKDVILGGMTDTYIDPETGTHVNVGVVDFHNITVVTDYFTRLNVSWTSPGAYNYSTLYYDFDTGPTVPSYVPAYDDDAIRAAFLEYINILTTNYS